MVCYAIPTVAAIVHKKIYGRHPKWKDQRSLNLLLWGGAIFGIIDHLWNGELFLIGPNIGNDILLGITITLVIVAAWGILTVKERTAAQQQAVAVKENR
ncbi:MAG: hypothetical protein GXP63_01470 [DPANN group archaeon]|nr:hypothetical protein [DPANN group archaeon]